MAKPRQNTAASYILRVLQKELGRGSTVRYQMRHHVTVRTGTNKNFNAASGSASGGWGWGSQSKVEASKLEHDHPLIPEPKRETKNKSNMNPPRPVLQLGGVYCMLARCKTCCSTGVDGSEFSGSRFSTADSSTAATHSLQIQVPSC